MIKKGPVPQLKAQQRIQLTNIICLLLLVIAYQSLDYTGFEVAPATDSLFREVVAEILLQAFPQPTVHRDREGKANKEIAADLNLSVKTVEAHRAQLMDRLGIHDVAGVVRLAIRAGLVTPDG